MSNKPKAQTSESYRHYIPQIGLSIEKNTGAVPSNGYYYLVKGGAILGKFKSLKQAETAFRAHVKKSGFQPQPETTQITNPAEQAIQEYLAEKDLYWAESHKHKGKGGKGGRGGV